AASEFGDERARRQHLSVDLAADGAVGSVVEKVAERQALVVGGMEREHRAAGGDGYRTIDRVAGPQPRLHDNAGAAQSFDECLGGAVETGRLGGVDLDEAVVDSQ